MLRNVKNNPFFILLLIMVLAVGTIAGCGKNENNSTSETSKIPTKEPGKLIVGFCATWPPFEYRDEKGEIIGFDVDLAREIGKDLGLEVEFKDADWQGLVPSLQKGDYDILITCFGASEARGQTVAFSDPYYELGSSIVVLKNNDQIKSKEDLAGKVVGVQLGSADEMAAEELNKEIGFKELKKFKLPPDEFMDLKQGGVDAVIIGYPYAVHNIKKMGEDYKIVGEPFNPEQIVMVVRKDNTQLLEAVNKSLARIKQDGTYDKLIKKWLSV